MAIETAEALHNPADSANKYFGQVIEHYSQCCASYKDYEVERKRAEENAQANGTILSFHDFDCELMPFHYDVYGTRDTNSKASENTSVNPPLQEKNEESSQPANQALYMAIQDPDGWSNVRKEPKGEILRRANNGETAELIGKSEDGKWIELRFSDGIQRFVHSSRLLEVSPDE